MADDDAARRALQRVSDAEREQVAERIRAAAADGRLGLDELDDRLGSALAARTRGDLDAVVDDLGDGVAARPAAEPMAIRAQGSPVQRTGHWVVPERITVNASMSSVLLDFTEATFAGGGCQVDVELSASSLLLVVPRTSPPTSTSRPGSPASTSRWRRRRPARAPSSGSAGR